MTDIKLEYIWVGGNNELRSKTRVIFTNKEFNLLTLEDSEISEWNFDGSSTNQANCNNSEIIIKPVSLYKDPFRNNDFHLLVLCDTWTPDNKPHKTNTRILAKEIFDKAIEQEPWFGMEQEFFVFDNKTGLPLGFPTTGLPPEQGQYYCSVGTSNAFGREFLEEVLDNCLYAEVPITGINFEVCFGQMEIQVCSTGIEAGDNLLIIRYILQRTAEKYKYNIDFSAKPLKGVWNGSGCHTNFSTKDMRENENGYELILDSISRLRKKHAEHIDCYGKDNNERLTGICETSSISTFSCGVADRGTSIRIPKSTEQSGRGYFEDRRPSSSCDPYLVTSKIFKTCVLDKI